MCREGAAAGAGAPGRACGRARCLRNSWNLDTIQTSKRPTGQRSVRPSSGPRPNGLTKKPGWTLRVRSASERRTAIGLPFSQARKTEPVGDDAATTEVEVGTLRAGRGSTQGCRCSAVGPGKVAERFFRRRSGVAPRWATGGQGLLVRLGYGPPPL